MANKQTAVEWFESEFKKYYSFSTEEMETFTRMFNQAKAMEKEQIVHAYNDTILNLRTMDGEQYYNETYGKE